MGGACPLKGPFAPDYTHSDTAAMGPWVGQGSCLGLSCQVKEASKCLNPNTLSQKDQTKFVLKSLNNYFHLGLSQVLLVAFGTQKRHGLV